MCYVELGLTQMFLVAVALICFSSTLFLFFDAGRLKYQFFNRFFPPRAIKS